MLRKIIFPETDIEKVKAYWNARPCNIRHSPEPPGTRKYFDQVEARKYFVEPHIPYFAEFPRWKGKSVLEIGCGIGTDTVNFARQGARVTAIELSERSLEMAKKHATVYGLEDRIRFIQGNAEDLPSYVPVEPYDLIYSFGVIHHTPHPERVIEKLCFYCHSETIVKLMVYYRYAWKVFWIFVTTGKGRFWRIDELIAKHSEAQTGCPITYTYTIKKIRKMLLCRGFRVTDMCIEHIFPYRIPDYVRYNYVKVWYLRWIPKSIFRWLECHFGWHLCITAKCSIP